MERGAPHGGAFDSPHFVADPLQVKGLGVDVLLVAPGAITSKFGKKQSDSFTMKSDSLFKSVAASIEERAQMSQRSDHSLPAAVLAKGVPSPLPTC